jgi:hypothetical protein
MNDDTNKTDEPEGSAKPGDFPREEFLNLLRAGLWPHDALAYLRVSKAEWKRRQQCDPALIEETRRAIAAFQLIHVRTLHERIQQANDWRGSAWWLAQRFPKRYGNERRRGGNSARLLAALDRALREEFSDPQDFERLERVFARIDGEHSEERQDHRIGQD